MPKKDSIFAEERKQKILDLVNRQSKATVSERFTRLGGDTETTVIGIY